MGNISGVILAILVAILGFFGWKNLDSRIGEMRQAERTDAAPAPLLTRIEAVENAMSGLGSNTERSTLAPLLARLDALERDLASGAVTAAPETPASVETGAGEDQLLPILHRLDEVESRLAASVSEMAAPAAGAADNDDLTALGGRLDSLEATLAEIRSGRDDDRIASMTRRLDSLESTLAGLDRDGNDDPDQLLQRVSALEADLESVRNAPNAAPAQDGSAPLLERLNALENTASNDPPGLAPLAERLTALERSVSQIEPGIGQQSLVPLMQRIQAVEDAVGGALAAGSRSTDENLIAGGFEFVDSEIVYFGYNSAALEDEAMASLARFADQVTLNSKIVIRGYADRRGSNIYNQNLALRRALNTEKVLLRELRDRNVYRNQVIALESAGEESQLVETDDDVEHAKNRAVKITLYR